MSISPDTDAIYAEAIELQSRVEVYEERRLEFMRLARDIQLELLESDYLANVDGEVRIEAIGLRSNQIMQERHPDLFKYLDNEASAFAAIRARNDSIVAAGWAEQFAHNSWSRSLREIETRGDPGELES